MPTLAYFDGIYIKMHPKDHEPPHVHVECENQKSCFRISDGEILNGVFPPGKRIHKVREWILERQDKLFLAWETKDFKNIDFS